MDEPKRCASCDIEISKTALVVSGLAYCCRGCAVGGPCVCSYVGDLARYPRNGHGGATALDLFGDESA